MGLLVHWQILAKQCSILGRRTSRVAASCHWLPSAKAKHAATRPRHVYTSRLSSIAVYIFSPNIVRSHVCCRDCTQAVAAGRPRPGEAYHPGGEGVLLLLRAATRVRRPRCSAAARQAPLAPPHPRRARCRPLLARHPPAARPRAAPRLLADGRRHFLARDGQEAERGRGRRRGPGRRVARRREAAHARQRGRDGAAARVRRAHGERAGGARRRRDGGARTIRSFAPASPLALRALPAQVKIGEDELHLYREEDILGKFAPLK